MQKRGGHQPLVNVLDNFKPSVTNSCKPGLPLFGADNSKNSFAKRSYNCYNRFIN
ncbi:hypothetical protein [Klebsiella phage Kpn02]|uniref:Uncharacterized protein n=1 Tax=Klebsiella phage Kpn02 TaxID=3044023 RepID=A0AAT9V6C7_9CAUD|nr:hypothetical protein [Klebsiella phage Kpn02]